jgi:hypothetical protein
MVMEEPKEIATGIYIDVREQRAAPNEVKPVGKRYIAERCLG